MSQFVIYKKDGSPTRYFWSDKDGTDPAKKRVYKRTSDGVMRSKNMRFDSINNRISRQ